MVHPMRKQKVALAQFKVADVACSPGVLTCSLQASIVLIDFWKTTDGVLRYLEWCAGSTTDRSVFFSNDACQQLYLNHVTTVLNRCAIMMWARLGLSACLHAAVTAPSFRKYTIPYLFESHAYTTWIRLRPPA